MAYDRNGNKIGETSDLGITDYAVTKDEDGTDKRSATFTFKGKEVFPKTTQEVVVDAPKQFGGGVMIALCDSYGVGIGNRWDAFAARHNMVCDHQCVIGSAIHNQGTADEELAAGTPRSYQHRMDAFIANYTGDGQTVGDKVYTAEDVKFIVVSGGANDGWAKSTLGESIYTTDRGTLFGGLHYIFAKLLKTFPNADIVCILQPIQWSDANATTGLTTDEDAQKYGFATVQDAKNLDGLGYGNFGSVVAQRIVRECAEWYGVTICDCALNWYKRIGSKDSRLWTPDGHMSAAGYDAVMAQLEKTVNNLPFSRSV